MTAAPYVGCFLGAARNSELGFEYAKALRPVNEPIRLVATMGLQQNGCPGP